MHKLLLTLILTVFCNIVHCPEVGIPEYVENTDITQLELTRENLCFVMDEVGIHHQDIVLNQALLETGNFTSKLCKKGNLFGLRHSKGYYQYEHWTESVIAYRDKIQSKYREGEDYYQFLKRIKYAESPTYIKDLKRYESSSNSC